MNKIKTDFFKSQLLQLFVSKLKNKQLQFYKHPTFKTINVLLNIKNRLSYKYY